MPSPNAVWSIDFKGQFRTRDGLYCYPLTVVDGFSRYLLGCRAQSSTTHEGTPPSLKRLFREYGLPEGIRSGNGVPFATQAIRCEYNDERLTKLSRIERPPLYEASPGPYPTKIPAVEYPAHFEIRRVSRNGGIRWKWKCDRSHGPDQPWINVSHVLAEEHVGLEEIDDGIWSMYFSPILLGRLDERELTLYGILHRKQKHGSPLSPMSPA